jgi:hypothetical protein
MAGSTGLEPAASGLTVQCANQAAPRARAIARCGPSRYHARWDRSTRRPKSPVPSTTSGKTFHTRRSCSAAGAYDSTARILLPVTAMTIIPKDAEIAAVVVLLGAVLITGLLRAF